MEIFIRKATETDAEILAQMQHQLNAMLDLPDGLEFERFVEYLIDEMHGPYTTYYTAECDGKVVGTVCVDVSEKIIIEEVEYCASIPFIFVDEKFRQGSVAYKLFKQALQEIERQGYNSLIMNVAENNPYKYLHFALADIIINEDKQEINKEEYKKIYILGVSNIKELKNLTFKDFLQKLVYTKKNFEKVFKELKEAKVIEYII